MTAFLIWLHYPFEPEPRHAMMTGRCGVDAVPHPIFEWHCTLALQLGKEGVEIDQLGSEFARQTAYHLGASSYLGGALGVVLRLCHASGLHHEGGAEYQAHLGKGLARAR